VSAALPLPEIPETYLQLQTAPSRSNEDVLYGAVALLMLAPLAFGAVELWAVFVIEIAAAALMTFWFLRQVKSGSVSVRSNPIFLPMCAFGALVLFQTAGPSSYQHATRSAFQLYIAYGCICFLITQTLTRTTQVRRIATLLATSGTLVAMFAVLQSLSSNGKIYWLRAPRFGGWIYGPYVNHNHYAGLMEMLTPIPLVFAFSKYASGRRRWLAAAAAAFMGATIFLSGSRGGMAAFSLQIAVFFWFLFRERTRNGVVLALAGFLLIALASVASIGGSEVSERISTLTASGHSDLSSDIRLAIYRDSLHMFTHRPILGWGLATFPDIYPQFRSFYTNAFVNRAHNDYLQFLTETGVLGFGLGIWFLVAALRPAIRKAQTWSADVNGAVALAALLGIAGILLHSFVDSNLQIPANALLFYVLCSVAAMDSSFRNHRREHRRRVVVEETSDSSPLAP
jgi:O-antigen ligase